VVVGDERGVIISHVTTFTYRGAFNIANAWCGHYKLVAQETRGNFFNQQCGLCLYSTAAGVSLSLPPPRASSPPNVRRLAYGADRLCRYDIASVELVREQDTVMMGMLISLGIEKGKPFAPDETAKPHAAGGDRCLVLSSGLVGGLLPREEALLAGSALCAQVGYPTRRTTRGERIHTTNRSIVAQPNRARHVRCRLPLDDDIDPAFGHTGVIGSALSDGDLLHNLRINPESGQFIRHDLAASQSKVVVGEL
jgi:hypothetical protein